MANSIFRPGRNCKEVAHADRVAFVIDSENYFRALMLACEHAEREIFIVGWDFDSRTVLFHDEGKPPVVLGEFLNGLARRNPRLAVRILDWDFPAVYGTDRERMFALSSTARTWKPHRRVDFRYDDTHPFAGSHHQKIVVIDDAMAFSGGLDLTNRRWDTCKHRPEDPRRNFDGKPYSPVHDVMIAVDGEAAKALGRVARDRWCAATGEVLKPVPSAADPWPGQLAVDLTDVDVAVARTAPPTAGREGIREIEELYLDMIDGAKHCIYIENQYFTSRSIGEALARRLSEPDGPEIILVTRLLSHGWLEELTMSTLRNRLVNELRRVDRHHRFHAFYADVCGLADGTCLDVHSKVMVVDDEWLRIGSSNLSDRSMGMDTECDVVVEARGDARASEAIRRFRLTLIAEHVDAQLDEVVAQIEQTGSTAAAIMNMGSPSRRLVVLDVPDPPPAKLVVAEAGDPDEPIFEGIASTDPPLVSSRNGVLLRRALWITAALIAAAIALSLVWTQTSLKDYLTRENAAALATAFAGHWWAPLAVILAYVPASFVMFPRWIITTSAVIALGPWVGFVCGTLGVVLAGVVTFLPGKLVNRDTMRRLAGSKLRPLTRFMAGRGLVGVILVRLVPIAPFPVVNLVLGALRVKLWQFALGTAIGMSPGMAATTVLSDQLASVLDGSGRANVWLIAGALGVLAGIAFFSQRYIRRKGAH